MELVGKERRKQLTFKKKTKEKFHMKNILFETNHCGIAYWETGTT